MAGLRVAVVAWRQKLMKRELEIFLNEGEVRRGLSRSVCEGVCPVGCDFV